MKSKARARKADIECWHTMRTLRASGGTPGSSWHPCGFPSSKTCSVCGTINPKLKWERMWTRPNCGTRHDRNLNAAINLRNLIMPVGRSRNGRGQEAMGQQGRRLRAKVIAVLFRHKKSRPCRG